MLLAELEQDVQDELAELYRELCREILAEDTETQYEADGRWIRDC